MTTAEPTKQVAIRMPLSTLEALRKKAKEHEKKTGISASVSDIIRSFVRDGLRRGARA